MHGQNHIKLVLQEVKNNILTAQTGGSTIFPLGNQQAVTLSLTEM